MSEKKKKLIIFGSLCLGLLISLVAFSFYIFKNQNNDSVNVAQRDGADNTEKNKIIRERIIKKVGYRPYFIEDEDASPLHFSSAFLVDTAIAVIITVLTVVALIKTRKFGETLNIIEKKIVAADKEKPKDIEQNYFFSVINVAKYQIILLSVVYLLSFFTIYPLLFLLLSLYRKISSLSAYNYLKQLVKKNEILVGLCSTLGLILSLIIGYFFLYLEAKKNVRSGKNVKLELGTGSKPGLFLNDNNVMPQQQPLQLQDGFNNDISFNNMQNNDNHIEPMSEMSGL